MKTETHLKYAVTLSAQQLSFLPSRGKKTFILGCIMPDIDMLSYLKGFFVKPFFGHDWSNSRSYIMNRAERLDKGRLSPFGLGLLVHYICDAFTFAHAGRFDKGLIAHTAYEKSLERSFYSPDFACCCPSPVIGNAVAADTTAERIEGLHRLYLAQPPSEKNDTFFIRLAAELCVEKWKSGLAYKEVP